MASAFNKEVRRSITHSLGRFLAIAIIAALGCGFYAGLRMTPIDMNISADAFYDGTNMSDLYVTGTLGLDDADVDELRNIEGVQSVMPVRMVDAYAMLGSSKYVMSFSSLDMDLARSSDCSDGASARCDCDDYINRPVLVDGAWPENPGECVIAADAVLDEPVSIGDTISIVDEGEKTEEVFENTSFTVTGLVRSPYFVMTSNFGPTELGAGEIDTYVFIEPNSFASDYPYTGAFVIASGSAAEQYPSDAYDEKVGAVVARIESMSFELRSERLHAVKAKAQEELDDKRAEYESERADALAKLDDAAGELSSAKAKLESGKAEMDSNEVKLSQLAEEIAQGKPKLEEEQAKFDVEYEKYQSYVSTLNELEANIAKLKAAIAQTPPGTERDALQSRLNEVMDTYVPLKKAVDDATPDIENGKKEFAKKWKELHDGERAYQEGMAGIAKGRFEYEEGMARYESGRAEYLAQRADAMRKLADAETKINEAQADIDEIELPDLYILDRSKNAGASGRASDAERIDQIAQVFPFIFFLVAALVALTTMTRMVDEERMLIGTYKALGYGNARITSKYLVYAFVASGIGCVIGIVVLSQFLPQFIMQAYSIIYSIPVAMSPIDVPIALLAAGLTVGVVVLATLFAALSSLREKPASLMLPRAPKAGKRILLERIGFIWKRLSFTWKVTARNIFRYKRRFLMAVIGIAGCTALLLTGLGLHDGINDIIDKQFGEIQPFNLDIQSSDEQSEGNSLAVEETLSQYPFVTEYARISSENVIVSVSGSATDVHASLKTPEDMEQFSDFYLLRERVGHKPLDLDTNGAIISEKLANELGVKKGDTIELYEQSKVGERSGIAHEVPVAGIMEYYAGQRVFMSPDLYADVMGKVPNFSDIVCKAEAPLAERTELANELLDIGGVEVVSYYDEVIDTYRTMLKTVNAVVVVLIVAAMLLAFVVLYNLTNINITERTREIATLKVLGFTPHETNAYIYRETILLTIIGALVGCVLGIWMEGFVVVTAEVDQMMFGRDIHAASFAIAYFLTIAFSIIVTIAMKPKLKSIDMVESLKSVD